MVAEIQFEDRKDAGRQLGEALIRYRGAGLQVLAIPRGGVAIGDDVVVVTVPPDFHAVAQVYRRWHDVTDEEALSVLGSRR